MQLKWTSHLSSTQEQEDFKKEIYGSKRVLERLRTICDEMEKDLNVAESSLKNYEVPNWDYRQAHNNGYRQCLQIIKRLADLDQRIITT